MRLLSSLLVFCTIFCQSVRANDGSSALALLISTQHGQQLVQKAIRYWGLKNKDELLHLISLGEVSKTDAVLTRQLDLTNGQEIKTRKLTIYLRKGQTLKELTLDLAHELTHATSATKWDPYDPTLTAEKYILLAIDAPGGEADALFSECLVELAIDESNQTTDSRCQKYQDRKTKQISRQKILEDFYKIGSWKHALDKKLAHSIRQLPLLSDEPPVLYSSTGNAPYPVALLEEFETMNKIACQNSKNRLKSMRSPATNKIDALHDEALSFLSRRCALRQVD